MSWFPDLARESMVAEGEHVRAVGWLASNQPYTRGPVPPEFVARLQEFVDFANESCDALWFGVFGGVHTCEFCRQHHDSRNFGVPAGELLYVAPAMIGHYVEQHGYAPPSRVHRRRRRVAPAQHRGVRTAGRAVRPPNPPHVGPP